MRRFNVTGLCIPEKHYMVDISEKIAAIKKMVDYGDYLTINRARQYGKTTTLYMLERLLNTEGEYLPISISFEGVGAESFESAKAFCKMFTRLVSTALKFTNVGVEYINTWKNAELSEFIEFGEFITDMCEGRKLVLLVDEVDKTSNNEVFLNFLGVLRDKYLKREAGKDFTFHSVILAGVTDIKNIKLRMIERGYHRPQDGEGVFNSPWNIAVNFDVDLSFNPSEIASMLSVYSKDNSTHIDITSIVDNIYAFTSGYPFLVSLICKLIDENLEKDWTVEGIRRAIKMIFEMPSTFVDDLGKILENNSSLYDLLRSVLIKGEKILFQLTDPVIRIAYMYCLIKNYDGRVAVSNRIFEVLMYNHFILRETRNHSIKVSSIVDSDIIQNGRINMQTCLERFALHFAQTFTEGDTKFLEENGRQIFLTYLKPLINGQGFYHIESQLLDQRRMDIVVDYGKQQFIIELKMWYGQQRHEDAYAQLVGYLDTMSAKEGYLLTFDLRKNANKENRAQWIIYDGKKIFDVMV